MNKTEESKPVYNGDQIQNTFTEGNYLVVVCTSSIYRIDLISQQVIRLL